MRRVFPLLFLTCITFAGAAFAQTPSPTPVPRNYPAPVEGDFVIPNFHFRSGEVLPELRIHYRTIGTARPALFKVFTAGTRASSTLSGLTR